MTVSPMPERAGCKLPSFVRVPSGNKMMPPPASKPVEDRLQSFRAAAIAVHRHGIPRAQQRADAGKTEQRFAREIIDVAPQAGTDQRRIEKTRVVRGQNHAAVNGTFSASNTRQRK